MFETMPVAIEIRTDITTVLDRFWDHLRRPGATLTGAQRVDVAHAARTTGESPDFTAAEVSEFANHLMRSPATIKESDVRRLSDCVGDPQTVEVIAIVSMLSAVDGFHHAMGLDLPALPEPISGDPTGEIASGLKRRRTHVPVPPGTIPFTLNLVPGDARVFIALQGPLYMTDSEMDSYSFHRSPGLDRAQMELVASRLSFHNKCFY